METSTITLHNKNSTNTFTDIVKSACHYIRMKLVNVILLMKTIGSAWNDLGDYLFYYFLFFFFFCTREVGTYQEGQKAHDCGLHRADNVISSQLA